MVEHAQITKHRMPLRESIIKSHDHLNERRKGKNLHDEICKQTKIEGSYLNRTKAIYNKHHTKMGKLKACSLSSELTWDNDCHPLCWLVVCQLNMSQSHPGEGMPVKELPPSDGMQASLWGYFLD